MGRSHRSTRSSNNSITVRRIIRGVLCLTSLQLPAQAAPLASAGVLLMPSRANANNCMSSIPNSASNAEPADEFARSIAFKMGLASKLTASNRAYGQNPSSITPIALPAVFACSPARQAASSLFHRNTPTASNRGSRIWLRQKPAWPAISACWIAQPMPSRWSCRRALQNPEKDVANLSVERVQRKPGGRLAGCECRHNDLPLFHTPQKDHPRRLMGSQPARIGGGQRVQFSL